LGLGLRLNGSKRRPPSSGWPKRATPQAFTIRRTLVQNERRQIIDIRSLGATSQSTISKRGARL